MYRVNKIRGQLVLDSRGNPTVCVYVHTKKYTAKAMVPSGASTGKHEALELRDHTKAFHGKGVSKALKNLYKIERKIKGMDVRDPRKIDEAMIHLDGTPNKSKLGANSILGVSMAVYRLKALAEKKELYEVISSTTKRKPLLPVPFANVINGGVHSGNELAMQEFMIAPIKAKSFNEATKIVSETYHELKSIIAGKYGKQATAVGDEGGFAPPIRTAVQALNLIVKAIASMGYKNKLRIAMDPAASEFYKKGRYVIEKTLTREQLISYYLRLLKKYPVISLEDPFAEDDFKGFNEITKKIGNKVQIVGDDLLVTNTERIKLALSNNLCNALLLKINQIGTVSEAIDAAMLAFKNNWNVMVSHRSGETEDTFIADLAVGLGTGQIKLGSPCRGERTAKYNRLMEIENSSKIKFSKF